MATLTYGVKNGNIKHVDEVEQGLKCECVCPNCGEKLIARQGEINEHHFAHVAAECNILIAQQTAIHLMAKEILAEYKIVKLPKYTIHSKSAFLPKKEFKELDERINKDNLIYDYLNGEEQVLKFDNVYLEQPRKDIVPDLVCEYGENKMFIEIAVTNFINEVKYNKIRENKIATIEINLSEYKDRIDTMTKRRLSDILIDDVELKKWIYDPKYKNDIDNIIQNNKSDITKQQELIQQHCNMFLPENYIFYPEALIDEKYANNFWRKHNTSKIPWYVGYPIFGDFIFLVDRRIWQAFIINTIKNTKFDTYPKSMWKYMKTKEFLRINSEFIEPTWISEKMKFSGLDVVEEYYKILKAHGIINERGLLINGK